jgi:ATP-dependent DNA helicase DinG
VGWTVPGEVIPLDPIAAIFGATGLLSRSFPGYSPREGQVAMARVVNDVLRDGGGACCDAPCGTGKSVAYLAPAILRAVKTGEKVVVATANIALQEQLVGKDLPTLREVLAPLVGSDWKFALLKGRSNYVCRDLVNDPSQREEFEGSLSSSELAQLRDVDRWAARTETGDRSELPFTVADSVWRMRSMDTESCHGKACESYGSCFARAAHEEAANAAVVVTNYHLLFAHIALQAETDGRVAILPKHHALVMDEAHEAGDIARDFFGHTITEGRIKKVVRWCRSARQKALSAAVECPPAEGVELANAADAIEMASDSFFRAMESAMAPLMRKKVFTLRSDRPECADALALLGKLGDALCLARKVSGRIFARIKRMVETYGSALPREVMKVQRDAERAGRTCVKALSWITDATSSKESPETDAGHRALDAIHWIAAEEKTFRGVKSIRYTWESRHIDLSPVLRAHVWDHIRTVVACSATMTTGEGPRGWTWIKRQLGAPQEARTLSVSSPFDFARNALLCLPADAPDPTQKTGDREAFDRYVMEVAEQLSRAAGGRTLGLFTSSRMARAAAEHLREQGVPFDVLAQGDAPRTQLVQAFKADEASVLMGTSSLWTGVDVPGPACICVVIDKLPFAPPGDPVMDAIQERAVARTGREMAGFMEESLPRAVLALRQGAGRLIRSTSDFGCVVICDPRLVSKGYGGEILRALGMPTRTRSAEAAGAWVAREMRARGVGMRAGESGRRAVGV